MKKDNDQTIVATVSRERARKLAMIGLVMLGFAPLALLATEYLCRLLSGLIGPTEELALRIMGMVVALSVIGAAAEVLLASLSHEVVECAGWLVSRRGRWRLSAVALDNIREIQLRETGSAWSVGTDQGVGLVLHRPRYINMFGWTSRIMPRIEFLLGKSHTGFCELYQESPQVIASRIAELASKARGAPVPIRNFGLRGASTLEARPVEPIVPTGVRCVICGYELRLLPRDGVCPECGAAVRRSLERGSKLNGDVRWISDLRWGSLVLVLSGLMWIAWVALFTRGLTWAFRGQSIGNYVADVLRGPFLAAYGLLLVGAWLYTCMPRGDPEQTGVPWTRRASRIALWIPVLTLAFVYGGVWTKSVGFWVFLWATSVILGFLLWYSVHLLGRMGRPVLRYLASGASAIMMMIAAYPLISVLLDGLSWVFPGLAAASPNPSPPSPGAQDLAIRALPRLISMALIVYVGSWTAVFAAVWWALRKSTASQTSSPRA